MRSGFTANSTVIGIAASAAGVGLLVAGVVWMSRPSAPAGGSHTASVATLDPVEQGRLRFQQSCSNCHGPEGRGLPRTGPDLTASKFVATKSDAELVDFIKAGRMPGQPGSVMNLPMPPRGGNMTLTEQDLACITKHVRTLQAAAGPIAANANQ